MKCQVLFSQKKKKKKKKKIKIKMSSAASWLDALSVKKIREVDRLNSFYEDDIFYGFLFASLHTSPLLKRSLPWKGRKFFLFRVDLLSEWRQEQS